MDVFPVDEGNLSFSFEDDDKLFLTQSSFSDVSTQDVEHAVDFLGGLEDSSLAEVTSNEVKEVEQLSQKSEEMCGRVFDFTEGEVDNGWSVASQSSQLVAIRHSDGKEVVVGADEGHPPKCEDFDVSKLAMPLGEDLEKDLQRFSSIVSVTDLMAWKRKQLVICFLYLSKLLYFSSFYMCLRFSKWFLLLSK